MAVVSRSQPPALADPNGAAMAAVLGAGIGSFAMGAFVLLDEAGLFAAPASYGPAGGLTGRTTFATIAWLRAWGVLHALEVTRGSAGTGLHMDRRTCRACYPRHVSTTVGFAVIAGTAARSARPAFTVFEWPAGDPKENVRCTPAHQQIRPAGTRHTCQVSRSDEPGPNSRRAEERRVRRSQAGLSTRTGVSYFPS